MSVKKLNPAGSLAALNKIQAGTVARINGRNYETEIRWACNQQGIALIRIPDGCRQTMRFGRLALIRVRSPFDFVAARDCRSLFFDAKSTEQQTFPYSKINREQLRELFSMMLAGCKSGYLVKFPGKHVFFDAACLHELRRGKSLRPEDGADLGPASQPPELRRLFP